MASCREADLVKVNVALGVRLCFVFASVLVMRMKLLVLFMLLFIVFISWMVFVTVRLMWKIMYVSVVLVIIRIVIVVIVLRTWTMFSMCGCSRWWCFMFFVRTYNWGMFNDVYVTTY